MASSGTVYAIANNVNVGSNFDNNQVNVDMSSTFPTQPSFIIIHSLIANTEIRADPIGVVPASTVSMTHGFGIGSNSTYNYIFNVIKNQNSSTFYVDPLVGYAVTDPVVLVEKTAPLTIPNPGQGSSQFFNYNSSVNFVGTPPGGVYKYRTYYSMCYTVIEANDTFPLTGSSQVISAPSSTQIIPSSPGTKIVQSIYAVNYPVGGGVVNNPVAFNLFISSPSVTILSLVGTSAATIQNQGTDILASVGKNPLYIPPNHSLSISPVQTMLAAWNGCVTCSYTTES